MTSFPQKLQKFFVYLFTSASVAVVLLGIQRVKQSDTLALSPETGGKEDVGFGQGSYANTTAGTNGNRVAGQTITASGKAYQTPWGSLATTIRVKDGKVVAVEIPQLPDSPPSIYAKPYLIDQALRSGSSNIQGVSGATITSRAFKASLESALAQAAAQGAPATQTSVAFTDMTVTPPLVEAPAPRITEPATSNKTTSTVVAPVGVSGTFTGNAYQTPWGNAVASVTFSKGKITAVTMPQVPNSPPSVQAKPYLVAQALAAGNANIQGVSGATYVSIAFKSSLESAIAKASAQGTVTTSTTVAAPSAQTIQPSISRTYHDDDDWDDDEDDDNEWDD